MTETTSDMSLVQESQEQENNNDPLCKAAGKETVNYMMIKKGRLSEGLKEAQQPKKVPGPINNR